MARARAICRICESAHAHAHGRCITCRAYFLNHDEERPWDLILRHNARLEEEQAVLASRTGQEVLARLTRAGLEGGVARRLVARTALSWVPGACWLWQGALSTGYGELSVRRRPVYAHRLMFEFLVGPIPPGLELDHLCVTPRCVNPDHLEPVTGEENRRRAFERRTHCVNGHRWVPANIYTRPDNGTRQCRACIKERKALAI